MTTLPTEKILAYPQQVILGAGTSEKQRVPNTSRRDDIRATTILVLSLNVFQSWITFLHVQLDKNYFFVQTTTIDHVEQKSISISFPTRTIIMPLLNGGKPSWREMYLPHYAQKVKRELQAEHGL